MTVVSADRVTSGTPAGAAADAADAVVPTRRARVRIAAVARGVPLATIVVAVAVVAATYLAGKLAYWLRDVLLLLAVAGFLALILKPLVLSLQRWRIPRRGWAVAVVTVWAALVFIGLAAAFGYPLLHGLTQLSHRLPSYVTAHIYRPGQRSVQPPVSGSLPVV